MSHRIYLHVLFEGKEIIMDLSNLKSSLFGYNKLAVSNYVFSLENTSNQKIQDL